MHVKGDEEKIPSFPFLLRQFYAVYLNLALQQNGDNKAIKSERFE
jgi:hypothetical protein